MTHKHDAGRTVVNKTARRRRTALLGTAAAGLMLFGYGRSAYAQIVPPSAECPASASTVTCTGDVSSGIFIDRPTSYTDLIVEDITGDIAPGVSGRAGIRFLSFGDININSNTGEYKIETINGHGIEAISGSGSQPGGFVLVDHTGDIVVNDGVNKAGIRARSFDNKIEIRHSGDITNLGTGAGYSDGIYARANGAGAGIRITSRGDIENSDGGKGSSIFARTVATDNNGDIFISHHGDVKSNGQWPILGEAQGGGDVTIIVKGDATKTNANTNDVSSVVLARVGTGPNGNPSGDGNILVVVDGDSTNEGDGLGVTGRTRRGGSVDMFINGDVHTTVDGNPGSNNGFNAGIVAEAGVFVNSTELAQTILDEGWSLDVNVAHKGDITAGVAGSRENQGIRAESAGGDVRVVQHGNIKTYGDNSEGIRARTRNLSGDITVIQDGTITTEGAASHGIEARAAAGGDVTITHDGDIDVSGDGADGILVQIQNQNQGDAFVKTSGSITAADRGILVETADGNASLEIASFVTGGSGVAVDLTKVLSYDQETEKSGAGTSRVELQPGYGFDGIVDARNNGDDMPVGNRLVFGGPSGEATFDLSQLSNKDGTDDDGEVFFGFDNVFLKEDQSNFIFTGQNQAGAEYEEAEVTGGLAILDPSARLKMADGASAFKVSGGGLGAIGEGGVLDGDVTIHGPGAIVLSNAGPFDPVSGLSGTGDVLRITGNHHSNGGSFYLDTVLNDGSPQKTDKLVVDGDTSGKTTVFVENDGGKGGKTGRGRNDGIKIVDVGGDSDGDFALASLLFAGAFEYDLNQANGQDWFLQSHVRDAGVIAPYVPYTLRTMGRELTGTYFERTGTRIGWQDGEEDFGAPGSKDLSAPLAPTRAGWVRVLGSWSDADGSLLNGYNDVSYEEDLWAIQGGFDGVVSEDENGTLVASIFMHTGEADTDSRNRTTGQSAGSTDTDGWGGGLALTYAAYNGFYVDGVTTYTYYDIDTRTSIGDTGSTDGDGWTLSGEAGKRMAVGSQTAITPQAQLLYQDISIDSFADSRGAATAFSDASSLEGRLGATFEYTPMVNGSAARVYAEFNIVHEFLDNPVATVAGTPLALAFEDTGYEVGGGIEIGQKTQGLAFWVETDYRAPFDSGDGIDSWSVTGGAAYRF